MLGTEGLVVDLGGGFDEVLEVGAGEEVTQVNKLAVVLVLDYNALVGEVWGLPHRRTVDNAPLGLASTNVLSVDNDCLLRADDGEGNEVLSCVSVLSLWT